MLRKYLPAILVLVMVLGPASGALAAWDSRSYQRMGALAEYTPPSWKFVFAADSHIGHLPANEKTKTAFEYMIASEDNPKFALIVGDMTETGDAGEYALLREMTDQLPFPVYGGMGNHESRWQDSQGALLASFYGPRCYSFDYGLWHFVVLDSTSPGQTLGTLDPSTIEWLEADLRAQPKTKPIALFTHHPVLYEPSRFTDADDRLAAVLNKYPCDVCFCGHGHMFIHWQGQGAEHHMTGALMDGAYTLVEVNGTRMDVVSVEVGEEGARREHRFSAGRTLWGPDSAPKPDPVSNLRAQREGGELNVSFTLSRAAEVKYRLNGGAYAAVGVLSAGDHEITLDISGQAKGYHRLEIRAEAPEEGPYYSYLEVDNQAGDLVIWRVEMGSAAVGPMISAGSGRFIVGTRDGAVRMMDTNTGECLWEYQAQDAWGGAVVHGTRLFFGTARGEVHCLDLNRGTAIWRSKVDDSGFAAAPAATGQVSQPRVFVGASSGTMYALNGITGAVLWTYEASGAIASQPALADGAVFFGAWDTYLHAVDQGTGEGLWKAKLGRQIYYSPYLSPCVQNGVVYATTPNDPHAGGSLLGAFDQGAGQELWSVRSGVSLMAASISSDGELVVQSAGGSIYGYSPSDGTALWRMPGNSCNFTSPPGKGPEYITGGYRGLITLVSLHEIIDFKCLDGSIYVSPLLVRIPGTTNPTILVADSAGHLMAMRFPGGTR